ncbi:molybdenum cofactor biosynthesis protein MoaE [Sphingomonas gilva]|uniref:Molybdopterin synthase catalytic subunit n=1 Tax=Sphingomonas gilva TaxID=2305907 RepID=A0A396RM03_9SPHN|nr:molybdenum cofactor biosynthesis protein MoaE [Sphingomonas gilva]RHW17427.1 molybdenum cofactor biosynthesis protein MoaE [Sphingomonas gilva]
MIVVRVQPGPLDPAAELAALGASGAVASFTGHVRADDGVRLLELEHYPGMTERALEELAAAAAERWPLSALRIVHRVGAMQPGEAIVFVGAASDHRAAALEATAYLIDRLKTDAPFWKRESRGGPDAASWVERRAADDEAATRWD